jgi:hypothetical protein
MMRSVPALRLADAFRFMLCRPLQKGRVVRGTQGPAATPRPNLKGAAGGSSDVGSGSTDDTPGTVAAQVLCCTRLFEAS